MIDIDEFMKSLKIRITGLEDNILEQVMTAIKENMVDELYIKLKCDWITCKFNSERDNEMDNQEGECQFIGIIHLNVPEEDIENECLLACRQFQAGEKHPEVKMWFTFPER